MCQLSTSGTAFIEFSGAYPAKGNFGFDPLGFASGKLPGVDALPKGALPNVGDSAALELAEIKNGRLAMMAIMGMMVQQVVWGEAPITDALKGHFTPF